MPSTALVWFRRDLRVHDHPGLTAAHRDVRPRRARSSCSTRGCSQGRFPSRNRAWFLLRLPGRAARRAARARRRPRRARGAAGGGAARAGRARSARARVYFASDVSPFALRARPAGRGGAGRRRGRGAAAAGAVRRRHRAGAHQGRPPALGLLALPPRLGAGRRGARSTARRGSSRSPPASRSAACPRRPSRRRRDPIAAGRAAPGASGCSRGCARASSATTSATTCSRAGPRSSRPTCTSAASRRASSSSAPASAAAPGADAFVRQLAWRDFYAHVLLNHPGNARHAHRREFDRARVGRRRGAARRLARGPHRLSRSSTPRCASCSRAAGCTTAAA